MIQKGFVFKYFLYDWPWSFVNVSECTGLWAGVVLLSSAVFQSLDFIRVADYILTQSLYHRSPFLLFLSTDCASVVSVAMILIETWYWESRKDIVYHQFMVSTMQKSRSKCHVMRQFSADHNLENVECSCTAPMLSWWERRLLSSSHVSVCRQPPVSSQHSLFGALLLLFGFGTVAHKKRQPACSCRYFYKSMLQDYQS